MSLRPIAETALWAGIGAVVAAAHGAAIWHLADRTPWAAPVPPAPAVIEIAFLPEPRGPAPETPEAQADMPEAQAEPPSFAPALRASEALPAEIPPASAPDWLAAPEPTTPEPTLPALAPLPTEPPKLVFATLDASDRPVAKPARRAAPAPKSSAPKTTAPKTTAPKSTKSTASKPAPAKASTSAPKAARAPGQSAGASGQSAAARAAWQAQAARKIAAHMQRARMREGGFSVSLVIDVAANGAVRARLSQPTGNRKIDAALLRHAAGLPRLPAPPDGKPVRFTLPIRF